VLLIDAPSTALNTLCSSTSFSLIVFHISSNLLHVMNL
jgi:hypothetical protein